MRLSKMLTVTALAAVPLMSSAAPSPAATAHNSQAGAWGSTTNACGPTPYFRDGGCLTSFFTGKDDGEVFARPGGAADPYRERPPLRALDR